GRDRRESGETVLERCERPASDLRTVGQGADRPALPRLRAVLRILRRRQRPRAGCRPPVRLDGACGEFTVEGYTLRRRGACISKRGLQVGEKFTQSRDLLFNFGTVDANALQNAVGVFFDTFR